MHLFILSPCKLRLNGLTWLITRFLEDLRGLPKFKGIRNYSGWTYPAKSGWKVNSDGKHGTVTLNDLGITLKMRGQAKNWGIPTTLTVVYKPSKRQWFASVTVDVAVPQSKFGSQSDLDLRVTCGFRLRNADSFNALRR